VRSRELKEDPFITGRGYLSPRYSVVASPDPDVSYETLRADDPSEPLPTHATHFTSGTYLTFVLHDVCWDMILRRLNPEMAPPGDTVGAAMVLFDLLAGKPFNPWGYLLPWNINNKHGMLRYDHTFGGFRPSSRVQSTTWMNANPSITRIDMKDSARSCDEDDEDLFKSRLKLKGLADPSQDIFAKLPAELVMSILISLQSADVCQLRLASRTVAEISRPEDLPQTFWVSRFRQGYEMEFYLLSDAALSNRGNWRGAYRGIREQLADCSRTGYLRNRRLMWENMRPVYECLSVYMRAFHTPDRRTCTISMPEKYFNGALVRADPLPIVPDRIPCIGGTSWVTSEQMWLPRDAMQSAWILAVTYRIIGGETYLSGLRLLRIPYDGDGTSQQVSRVGYPDFPFETRVALNISPDCLRGVRVWTSVNGIVGLRLLGNSDCDGCDTHLDIGQCSTRTAGIGVADLLSREGTVLRGIRVGIDVWSLCFCGGCDTNSFRCVDSLRSRFLKSQLMKKLVNLLPRTRRQSTR